MAKLKRTTKDEFIFSKRATEKHRLIFGKEVISDDIDDNLLDELLQGWQAVMDVTKDKPPVQWWQGRDYALSYLVAYLYQRGVAEYSAGQTYQKNSLCQDGEYLCISRADENKGNATTDVSKWERINLLGLNDTLNKKASTTQAGIVQLSSATNSTSETLAATLKAVKDTMDKANSAATAASTAQTTANNANTAAGTARTAATNANNNANGRVPTSRKINGKALTADITLSAVDIKALASTGGTVTGATNFTGALRQAGSDVITKANINLYADKYLVDSFMSSDGLSWYRIYSDGWIEQGGRLTSGNQTINFLKPFSSVVMTINVSYIANTVNNTNGYAHRIQSATNTSVRFWLNSGGGFWSACGK